MSRLSTFLFNPTASCSFIEDVLAQGNDYPLIRVEKPGDPDFGVPTKGESLQATLLRCSGEFCNCGNKKQPCAIFRMILVDGTGVMWSAALNSGLDGKLSQRS